jgi:type IV secretory pathway TrbL component
VVITLLLGLTFALGFGTAVLTTGPSHRYMFGFELALLLAGFVLGLRAIRRKQTARYQSLPATEQRAIDTWRRDALLRSSRHHKRWLAWIPVGTLLGIWESRHEELRYRFLVVVMGVGFFSWIFFAVRSLNRSVERIDEKLGNPTSGERQ